METAEKVQSIPLPVREFLTKKFNCKPMRCDGISYKGCLMRRGVLNGVRSLSRAPLCNKKCEDGQHVEYAFNELLARQGIDKGDVEAVIIQESFSTQLTKKGAQPKHKEEKSMNATKTEARVCAHPGCDKKLRSDSKGGYCAQHRPKGTATSSPGKKKLRHRHINKPQHQIKRAVSKWDEFKVAIEELGAATLHVQELAEELGAVVPVSEIQSLVEKGL